MSDSFTPPEGQTNFSGIPVAHFVDDVDAHMVGEDGADNHLKVINLKNIDFFITNASKIYTGFGSKTSEIQVYGDQFGVATTTAKGTSAGHCQLLDTD
jgi:hypothetical protein